MKAADMVLGRVYLNPVLGPLVRIPGAFGETEAGRFVGVWSQQVPSYLPEETTVEESKGWTCEVITCENKYSPPTCFRAEDPASAMRAATVLINRLKGEETPHTIILKMI